MNISDGIKPEVVNQSRKFEKKLYGQQKYKSELLILSCSNNQSCIRFKFLDYN